MVDAIFHLLNVPANVQGEAIRGLFSFAGILLTGLLGIFAWFGKQVLVRHERRRDLLQSLRAEVVAVWKQFASVRDLDRTLGDLKTRSEAAGASNEPFRPVIIHETGVSVFPSLIHELVALKEDEIEVIVRFYRQLKVAEKLSNYLHTDAFQSDEKSRQLAILADYLTMIHQVVQDAENVLNLIDPRLRTPSERRLEALVARLPQSDQ